MSALGQKHAVHQSMAALPSITKAHSRKIPIVFAVANDPVGGGMVKSLAQPGARLLKREASNLSRKTADARA